MEELEEANHQLKQQLHAARTQARATQARAEPHPALRMRVLAAAAAAPALLLSSQVSELRESSRQLQRQLYDARSRHVHISAGALGGAPSPAASPAANYVIDISPRGNAPSFAPSGQKKRVTWIAYILSALGSAPARGTHELLAV